MSILRTFSGCVLSCALITACAGDDDGSASPGAAGKASNDAGAAGGPSRSDDKPLYVVSTGILADEFVGYLATVLRAHPG